MQLVVRSAEAQAGSAQSADVQSRNAPAAGAGDSEGGARCAVAGQGGADDGGQTDAHAPVPMQTADAAAGVHARSPSRLEFKEGNLVLALWDGEWLTATIVSVNREAKGAGVQFDVDVCSEYVQHVA